MRYNSNYKEQTKKIGTKTMKDLNTAIEIAEDILTDLINRPPAATVDEEIILEGNVADARAAVRGLRNLKNSSTFMN